MGAIPEEWTRPADRMDGAGLRQMSGLHRRRKGDRRRRKATEDFCRSEQYWPASMGYSGHLYLSSLLNRYLRV